MKNKKVHALYYSDTTYIGKNCYTIKITNEKYWMNSAFKLENNKELYCQNNNMYLSHSRAELVKKAKEIKQMWIDKLNNDIEIIKEIEIK